MALLRSVATVGFYTMASRLLGFARDVLSAAIMGGGGVADAFFIAQLLPNLFRRLFAEGAFNAAFVPLFARHLETEGRISALAFAEQVLAVLLAVLFVFVNLMQIAMPWVIVVLAPGFSHDPAKHHLVIELTRITFPYLLFISLVSLLGAVLNSLHRFAAAAGTPILFNLCIILSLLFATKHLPTAGHAMAWGLTVSGMVQFVWLIFSCRREGIRFRLPRPRLTPEVRRMLGLMLPAALGAGVTQVNLLINQVLASFLPSGSISSLYYADRLMDLPTGVIGVALGTAILPLLSRQVASGQEAAAQASQNRALELGLLLTLPAAAAFMAMPFTLISVLFQHGAFGPTQTLATGSALAAYAIGLPGFALIKVLAPAFYARHDTRTPVRFAIVTMLANLAFNLTLIWHFKHVALALSLSLSTWVQAGLLAYTLHRRGHWHADARLLARAPRSLLSAAVMAGGVLLAAHLLQPWLLEPGLARYAALGLVIVLGGGLYGLCVQLTGAARIGEVLQQLRRRDKVAPEPG